MRGLSYGASRGKEKNLKRTIATKQWLPQFFLKNIYPLMSQLTMVIFKNDLEMAEPWLICHG